MKIIVLLIIMVNFLFAEKFCIIVEDEAIVTQHHGNNNIVNIPQKFGYGFTVGKKNKNFVEIIKYSNSIGWIDKKYIQCSENLSSDPYIDGVKVKTKNNKDSMLYKKYFFIEHTPKHNGNILYFALKENEHSVLLSKTSNFYYDNHDKEIIGGINKKEVLAWNSRVAIEPLVDNLPLYLDINFKKVYSGKIQKPKKYFTPRYPLISIVPNGIKISDMKGRIFFIHNRDRKNYKKVILARVDDVDELASAYTTMARTILKYTNNKKSITILKAGLGRAIIVLTGQKISGNQNIVEFLEQKQEIPKSEILNLTFNQWNDKVCRNINGYRTKIIREFRTKSVLLKALTAEKIYENITFDKQHHIRYYAKKDEQGNILVRKTKFNFTKGKYFENKSAYDNQWIWIPFKYLP